MFCDEEDTDEDDVDGKQHGRSERTRDEGMPMEGGWWWWERKSGLRVAGAVGGIL